ncbi:MAG TPA: efflux RND transporter periplasmic adaptor subunit [Terriglobales bacterium]|nr:efflux RND transporter periplasmic adaptor subunit [Terriglobales bacterium]
MTRSIKFVTTAIALLTVSAAIGCSSEKHETASAPELIRDVPVLAVEKTTVSDYFEAVGTVRASQSAQVASQMMGTVSRILVHEGDRVHRGQILAALDEAQPRAGVDRARAAVAASEQNVAASSADYALAESTLNRYQSLYDKQSVSPQEFDEVKGRYAAAKARRDGARAAQSQAKAALEQASNSYDYTKVRAPFDGVVTAKLVDAGALASPGTPLFVVEGDGRLRLEATVDERGIGAVRLGSDVPVLIDALGSGPLTGKVVQVLPAADPASRSFLVKVELPPMPQLRSGVFGRVRFRQGQRESLLVPQTALVHRGQLDGVFVLGNDQVVTLRYVTLGRADDKKVEVLSGLEHGERVVAQPGDRELSGKKVEVR